jgi:acyl-CoA reductase-like NAD-dependent aldehyde dehydrogenase
VQRDVYDEFVERYAAQAQRVKVGYPHDPATEVGALVHPEHFEKMRDPAVQRSPLRENTPKIVASIAASRSASAKTIAGLLPPSSIDS